MTGPGVATPITTRIQVRWTATIARRGGGLGRQALVVGLRAVDDQHLLVEAWLETPDGPRTVFERRPIPGSIVRDGAYVHVDASHDGRRLIALTLGGDGGPGGRTPPSSSHDDAPPRRAPYAWSCFLRDASLHPGAFDPPTVRLLTLEDAASA